MNELNKSKSPYLLQHADNPVHWKEWNNNTLSKAESEQKLIIVSIGYSTCHWCHVMAHESFEDREVATIMNEHFVSIKIDREERPDLDHYYMDALTLMKGQGGWPLNVICLPDGRPIYGGTYFPKNQWLSALDQLAELFQKDSSKAYAYAEKMQSGLEQMNQPLVKEDETFPKEFLTSFAEDLFGHLDPMRGGRQGAPKFPMPSHLKFLLAEGSKKSEKQTVLTLENLQKGGIYDQLKGGFARYSTDDEWKVPHFEKMLYDNGQLLEIYALAYRKTGNLNFKKVVMETIGWLTDEMKSKSGAYFSAIDADSEGEEGAFYIWKADEVRSILSAQEFEIARLRFGLKNEGNWEQGKNVLQKAKTKKEIAGSLNLDENLVNQELETINTKLLAHRNKREKPGIDRKQICSWNAMLLSGLIEAHLSIPDIKLENEIFQIYAAFNSTDQLVRLYNGNQNAFLEDYAHWIKALIDLYRINFDETYLFKAKKLLEYCNQNFRIPSSAFFKFSRETEASIAPKLELADNVISSSNSVMAENLLRIGLLFGDPEMLNQSEEMCKAVAPMSLKQAPFFCNWASVIHMHIKPIKELVLSGPEAEAWLKEISPHIDPFEFIVSIDINGKSELPVNQNRFNSNQTLAYICQKGMCKSPISSLSMLKDSIQS